TAIYDALILALEHMENAKHLKKAMLLITDGVNNASKHTLNEAVEATKRSRVAVYTVGLLSMSGGQRAEDSLIHIAEASGGHAYFPNNLDEGRVCIGRGVRGLGEPN